MPNLVWLWSMLVFGYIQLVQSGSILSPPEGNSVSLRMKTFNGEREFECIGGKWVVISARADLVDNSNPNAANILGNYSFSRARNEAKWTLLNNAGDATESGALVSIVTGKKIATEGGARSAIPQALLQADSHRHAGIAARVSYIQRLGTFAQTASDKCTQRDQRFKLPYEAQYVLWTQNMVPPDVPQPLKIGSAKAVQSFFGEGTITYTYDGHKWAKTSLAAKLSDVPGGAHLGDYSGHKGIYTWKFSKLQLTAKVVRTPVLISNDSLPWTVAHIIKHSSKTSVLADCTMVHMVCTRGGALHTKSQASFGQVSSMPFTALFWFYKSE